MFSEDEAARLETSGDPAEKRVAGIIRAALAVPQAWPREEGSRHEVLVLDKEQGFALTGPIAHPVGAAWLRGQRYTRSDALQKNPATTEELAAAGG